MKKIYALFVLSLLLNFSYGQTYHPLATEPLIQRWTNAGQITANDNWSGVPSIQGFLGQDITTGTGVNPQTLLKTSNVANDLDVIANQSNPAISNGGVAEFDGLPDPTIALQGSGTADAPNLVLYLNTTGVSNIRVQYNLRDIDTTRDNAVMQVALQYRIGNSGDFVDVPSAYVADATTGPSLATMVTAVDVFLPEVVNNHEQVQLRIMTTNAAGNDEWVGVDDIVITGNTTPTKTLSLSSTANAAEGTAAGTIVYNFSPATAASTTFSYHFSDGTAGAATFASDYTVSLAGGATISTKQGVITVPTATTTVTFIITPVDDAIAEGIENVQLTISDPSEDYTLGTATANITITDNDAAPTVAVSAGTALIEPAGNGNFNITLSSAAPAGGVTINYTLSGSATLNADYIDPQSGSVTLPEGQSSASIPLTVIDDALLEGIETISVTLTSASAGYVINRAAASLNVLDNEHPPIVINEVYGGGGNAGATFKNDFIELYNNSDVAVNVTGWSVQYSSAAGTTWQKTDLDGVIPAHGYYLVQEATGAGGTANLPTPDATGTIAMSGTAGKVALVSNNLLLTGACPSTTAVVDLVGFGTANCFEGSGPAPAPSNTTSITRNAAHTDANNNATDFTTVVPGPKNSVTDIAPPIITATNPSNGSADVATALSAMINFNEAVEKGIGNILLKNADGSTLQVIDVASEDVTVAGSSVSFLVQSLAFHSGYYVEIDNGAFKDLDGNAYAGISGDKGWKFATRSMPVAVVGETYTFTDCSTSLSDGFSFYSVAGPQLWACTTFGKDAANSPTGSAPNGVQINGFSGTNIQNEDWLISPSYDLSSTTYPLLSFWSRTRFNGPPLQLKVSTDYPGTGDPRNYTWTDINGKFPAQTTDVWTLSSTINLSAYKGSNVHFALVYFSSEDDGARWTLDDVAIVNSATPPPPSLTLSASDIQFPYVSSGSTTDRTFTFVANDLTAPVTLYSNGAFTISKDGVVYSSSISYTVAEANNVTETVHVRFAPTSNNQNFTGSIIASTADISDTVNLKGTSIDPATTLEVVNWNIEWFGSTGFGPTNENQQEQNVKTILQNVGADVYGLVEVVDETRFARVVSQMPGYSYVIGDFGSHVNPPDPSGGPLSEAQKLAFVYKTSVFSNVTSRALINNQNTSSSSYNNWSSGRYPFLMSADVTLNCVTKRINFILIHAKANTSPTATSYARRQAAAAELHDTLETYFGDANVIVLGDFNDDLDRTITDGINPPVSSYKVFTDDGQDFFSPTLALSLAGKKSTVSYNDIIDHVVITNDLQPYYMPGSANILTDVADMVNNYGTTTTDHYPVFTRYQFEQPAAPVITSCPVFNAVCATVDSMFTVPAFTATVSCGNISYSYVISGATERTGTGNNASGKFNTGTSIITWTVTDGLGQTATCQTTVVINSNPVITIPDAYALPLGTKANTVYIGYNPASSITLQSSVTGGAAPYKYAWSPVTSSMSSLKVSPTETTNYNVLVTDANGCTGMSSKSVDVMDVKAGKKLDKVSICHKSKSLEVSVGDVADHLAHGDQLGDCETEQPLPGHTVHLKVTVLPNPSRDYFSFVTASTSNLPVFVTVVDANGKLMDVKITTIGTTLKLGNNYRPGMYYALVLQGTEFQTFKLLKQ